jgi:hypothetical protein
VAEAESKTELSLISPKTEPTSEPKPEVLVATKPPKAQPGLQAKVEAPNLQIPPSKTNPVIPPIIPKAETVVGAGTVEASVSQVKTANLSVAAKTLPGGSEPRTALTPDQLTLIQALKTNEAALKAAEANEAMLKLSEANLKAEGADLKSQLTQLRRENQQLRESRRLLLSGLERVLRPVLLAEHLVEPGLEEGALSEVARRAELKSRLWGFKGTEIVQSPAGTIERAGLLLARPSGVSPEGKVLVEVEFHPREQAFESGEVLLVGGLILPSSPSEIRRRVALWERDAQDKLAQAGWIPEKLMQGGINLEEIVILTHQIAGKRGGAKVGIVALDDLFTTEPPKLGLKVMP